MCKFSNERTNFPASSAPPDTDFRIDIFPRDNMHSTTETTANIYPRLPLSITQFGNHCSPFRAVSESNVYNQESQPPSYRFYNQPGTSTKLSQRSETMPFLGKKSGRTEAEKKENDIKCETCGCYFSKGGPFTNHRKYCINL